MPSKAPPSRAQGETQGIERVLLGLLALAHPDKWSSGQPATELAHELTIAINRQREVLAEK